VWQKGCRYDIASYMIDFFGGMLKSDDLQVIDRQLIAGGD